MRWSRREILAGFGGSLALAAMPGTASAARVIGGLAFGTAWRVVYQTGASERAVTSAIRNVIAGIDRATSPFLPTSQIARFNAADTSDWQAMSADCCAVVRDSIDVASRTAGRFDPTIGPIVGRYGFGPIRGRVGTGAYRDIVVDKDRIRKLDAGLTLDLCGLAKGHAVDRMTTALERLGIPNFLVDFGGELCARGRHPDGRPWQVGVERPVPGRTSFQRILRLDTLAVATSGVAANSYSIGDRRFSHIIDPLRGEPIEHDLAAVSVLMQTAASADAMSTALMAMGPELGPEFAESRSIPALFIVCQGVEVRDIMTGAFADAVIA